MMRKIASLLLTAILLAAMLTVFAVPASARSFGPDPNNVGKWAHYNVSYDLNDTNIYYLITGVLSSERKYSVKGYQATVNNDGLYRKLDTWSFAVSELTIIPDSEVPQAIRNAAAEDYPDLFPTGSTLSEGNLAIITAVAGVAVGMAVMFFVMKKKKPALASGENTDEE